MPGPSSRPSKSIFWQRVCLPLAVLLAACSAAWLGRAGPVQASPSGWSAPELIFQGLGHLINPAVTGDPSGRVHAFWVFAESDQASETSSDTAIYYSQLDGSWTPPVDIALSTNAAGLSAAAGPGGFIHIIYTGAGSRLYYSSAPVESAAFARSWSTRALLSDVNMFGQILSDPAGTLHLVSAGRETGPVQYLRSEDGGVTWSSPVSIAFPTCGACSDDYVHLALGPEGQLYVVWTEFLLPEMWPPQGVYFSRSQDGGETWSAPLKLADEGYTQINVARAGDTLHVVWNGMAGVHGRYHRWSADQGQTWSDAARLDTPGLGGSEGAPQLAVDSGGQLHLITTDGGCVWYLKWAEAGWSTPTCISKAEHIENPALSLNLGDELHVLYWHDLDQKWSLWHASELTGSPAETPAAPAPPATASLDPAGERPAPTASPPPAPAAASFFEPGGPPRTAWNTGQVVLAGALPVLGLLIGTIYLTTRNTRK